MDIPFAIQEKLKQAATAYVAPLPFSENPWNDPSFSKRYTRYVDDHEIWGSGEVEVQKILSLLPQRRLNILDLGCGTGRHAYFLSQSGHFVTGIDQCTEAIRRAKKRKYQTPAKFIKVPYLQFKTNLQFDLILLLCALALNLSAEQLRAWIHLSMTLLAPGGSMLIDLPSQLPKADAYFFLDDRPLWHKKTCWVYHCCHPNSDQRLVLDSFFCCSLRGQLLPHHTVFRQYHRFSELTTMVVAEEFSATSIQEILPKSDQPPVNTPWILFSKK